MKSKSNYFSLRNPVPDLVNDDIWDKLVDKGLISNIGLRNYVIKENFHCMKTECDMSTRSIVSFIRKMGPFKHLSPEAIKKIFKCKIETNWGEK